MCTILTFDRDFYRKNQTALDARIRKDTLYNSDGFAFVGLDANDETNNIRLQTMDWYKLLREVDQFFAMASSESRVWIHTRMATTSNVGIGYVHGFDNGKGTVIMHNGMLSSGNTQKLHVDSFLLKKFSWYDDASVRDYLQKNKEHYANILAIDTTDYSYAVIRMETGTLFTDYAGNFSTNEVGDICMPVESNYCERFFMAYEEPYGKNDYFAYDSVPARKSVSVTIETEEKASTKGKLPTWNDHIDDEKDDPYDNWNNSDYMAHLASQKAKAASNE